MRLIFAVLKVETQDFASHKGECTIGCGDYIPVVAGFVAREMKGCAIDRGDYIPVVAEFVACETQNFASLLGWRHHLYIKSVLL